MLITPSELLKEPLAIDETFMPGMIDYAPDVRQAGPLRVRGEVELLEEHRGPKDIVEDIRIRARFEGPLELSCARCVEPIPQHVSGDFDLIFRPAGADAEQGERSISEAETEIGYYEESGLSLEDVVREQVLLSLPDRSLCREDCKGLCPHCGGNRNESDCGCGEKQKDPRWSALQGFSVKVSTGAGSRAE